jgi:hypothetical protein
MNSRRFIIQSPHQRAALSMEVWQDRIDPGGRVNIIAGERSSSPPLRTEHHAAIVTQEQWSVALGRPVKS